MVTIEDKLALFNKIVYEYEKSKSEARINSEKENNKNILHEKEKSISLSEKDYLDRAIDKANIKKDQLISKAEQENRDKILKQRNIFLQDIINSVFTESEKLVASDRYADLLLKMLDSTLTKLEDTDIIFLYLPKDKIAEEVITKECNKKKINFEIKESEEVKIGGFIAKDADGTFEYDMSFHALIENSSYDIGKLLYNQLR